MTIRCVVGGSRAAREARATEHVARAGLPRADAPPAATWPFSRDILPAFTGSQPMAVWLPDLHHAFLSGQTAGTRLVLTQSTYQLQRWLDWLDRAPGSMVIAHASRDALRASAAEAFARRGPWSRIELDEIDGESGETESRDSDEAEIHGLETDLLRLRTTFSRGGPQDRLDASIRAASGSPRNPALHLATASMHMELGELQPAQDALEKARALAPDWEAMWFEYGKLWLRADDLHRAAERFADAVRCMPSFAAALSNLGAALGEIDRPDEAVSALQQALSYDPEGYPILNNLGVIFREQGRLGEAVDAARRVTELAPAFVFGYYNMAHALFLQGRFSEARDAYSEGLTRDPQKNVVQACRYAVAKAATGDSAGAISDLGRLAETMSGEMRERALGEAEETLGALATLANRAEGVEDVLRLVKELTTRYR